MSTVRTTRLRSRIKRQYRKQDILGYSPVVGKHGSQLKSANTNEINRDIQLSYALFHIENIMFLLVQFSLNYPIIFMVD